MKIRNQLFFVFLILGVTVTLILSFLIYTRGKKIILTQLKANLEAVSQTKKIRLEGIIRNKYEQLTLITQAPFLHHSLMGDDHTEAEKNSHSREIDSMLRNYTHIIPEFYRIHFLNHEGKILYSSDSSFLARDMGDEESFLTIREKGRYLDGFHHNEKNELCLTGGVVLSQEQTSGILLTELRADEFISLTNDFTGLGTTGETVLAKEYQQPVLLTPTRFNPDAALKVKIPKNDPSYGMNLALEGKEGVFEDVLDYRHQPTIASTRYIEEAHWGLLTKMDLSEAYSYINDLRNFLILLNIGFIIFAFLTSYLIGRYLARPVEELISSTNKIREGELHARVRNRYNNELGQLSESFNAMAEKLERKINEMDKVGYVISHDLRAPLNSIIPLTDFIKEDNKGNLNEETEKMLDMIKEKCMQMNDLIKELLETARTEKKIKENVDVDSLVSMIISNLNPPSFIQIFIQHNLPIIHFHKISLMQVFQNLIHNAIKYMDKEKGTVNIGYSEEKDSYRFWVADNGPGIRESDRQRIFAMYETAHLRTNVESTGIGLGVAKKIIEENRGSIWVESIPGEGSTFYFTIPKL